MNTSNLSNNQINSISTRYKSSKLQSNTVRKRIEIFLTNDILYWFIFFIAITPMSVPFPKLLLPIEFVYTSIIFFMKKKRLSNILIYLSILWVIINILAFYRNISLNITSSPLPIFKEIMRLFLAYMIMSLLGNEFFYTLEIWLYKLSVLSLPLFILEIIYRPLFFRIAPYLNFATVEEQKLAGGWYGGFYTFNAWSAGRNSGFMWEAGGFAFILIFLIIFRLYQNSLKIDKHIIVYFICLATTLSTAGILAGFVLLLAYLVSKYRYLFPIMLIPLFVYIFISQIWQLEFLGPKINRYLYNINQTYDWSFGSNYMLRVNRFGIFYYAVKQSFSYPLGYGVFPVLGFIEEFGAEIKGPNSLAAVLIRWGWIGFILYILGLWNTSKYLFKKHTNLFQIMIAIAVAMTLFSNSLDQNLLVYCFLLYPFADKNNYSTYVYS